MPRPKKQPGELGRVSVQQYRERFRADTRIRDGEGRAHHVQGWGPSPEAAQDDLQRKAHLIWGGVFQQVDPAGTVEQLAVAWLLDLRRNRQWDEADPQPGKIKPQSIDRYEGTLHSTIKPLLWGVKITSLTPARIYNFLHEVARTKSNHEALMARSVLAGMFDLAILHGVVSPGASPVPSVRTLAIHRPASKLIALTDDDLAVIIQLVLAWEQNRGSKTGKRPDVRLLADLLILTNRLTIRLSEALALRREDVVLRPNKQSVLTEHVWINGTMTHTDEKGLYRQSELKGKGQERLIEVVNTDVHAVLKRRMADSLGDLLFVTRAGKGMYPERPQALARRFRAAHKEELDAIGVPQEMFVYRSMRKSAAAALGTDIAQQVLAHESKRTTTQHYTGREEKIVGAESLLALSGSIEHRDRQP